MSELTALYPGSFDPITLGHTDVVERFLPMFHKIYVCMGINTQKSYLFDQEKRFAMLQLAFGESQKIELIQFTGLTIDLCNKLNCRYLIRGIRSTTDLEYERAIAEANKLLNPNIETLFLLSSPAVSTINSTIVRELIRNKADVSSFVPKAILPLIY